MFIIKENNKTHLIDNIENYEDLFNKVKDIFKIPKYLQRLEYNGKSLNENIFNDISKYELVNLNLFLRFNIINLDSFIDKIIYNDNNIKKIPILIKNQYYDTIYCIKKQMQQVKYIEIIFRTINYNDKCIYLNINDDTNINWKSEKFITKLNYIIENENNKLSKIKIQLNNNVNGNGYIYITNIGINTDEDIRKKIKFKVIIRNGKCIKCMESIYDRHILVTTHGDIHKECI